MNYASFHCENWNPSGYIAPLRPDKLAPIMPMTQLRSLRSHAPSVCIFLIALVATWFAYQPGVTGSLHFDDKTNLGGLAEIGAQTTAWQFTFSGRAGPLGRPLAMASFVPQAHAWPDEPQVFLRTNILIHLLNGVLVTWFLYLLGGARGLSERYASMTAAASGTIWMLLPILASSSLFIVQRMTTLSAVFVLLGAVSYLYARRGLEKRSIFALSGMTLALGLGVTLGALSKENGVLLIMFVLATEVTLLRRPANISPALWRTWFGIVLAVPGILLLAYLATRLPYAETVILRRDYNGLERLVTQAQILWQYLYLAFFPNLPGLGPFHDVLAVQRFPLQPDALFALAAWGVAIIAAAAFRRKAPLYSFAVAWFISGHLLESTTIPLELYFEHRNYLPLIGPVYSVIAAVCYAGTRLRSLLIAAVAAYALVLGGVLLSVASLWGAPRFAAEMWYIYKPGSIRAAERIAKQLESEGELRTARRVFRDVRERNPKAHHLDLTVLLYSCLLEPDEDQGDAVRSMEKNFETTLFSNSLVELLQTSYNLVQEIDCRGIDKGAIYRLAQSALKNPRFNSPASQQILRTILAQIAIDHGDLYLAMIHIDEALSVNPDPKTLEYLVGMLNRVGLHEAAAEVIALARTRSPRHPVRARLWIQAVERLADAQLEISREFQF